MSSSDYEFTPNFVAEKPDSSSPDPLRDLFSSHSEGDIDPGQRPIDDLNQDSPVFSSVRDRSTERRTSDSQPSPSSCSSTDPTTGACTNLIENRWCIKRQLPSTHTRRSDFLLHLSEYIYCCSAEKDIFVSLLEDIGSLYGGAQ
ncbi:uncharacterized protein LOC124291529 [Haliotis rubra]|uniref:uncharacterized protein LOC124291529 n=1 Tax=Haliotis rubra TaxID=36100 RepID=UPI001EE5D85F|nr:uncharacterized protein LOC124291529 [Haliotis rubra]